MHSHLNTVLVFKRSEVHVLPNRYRNRCTDTEYVMMSVNVTMQTILKISFMFFMQHLITSFLCQVSCDSRFVTIIERWGKKMPTLLNTLFKDLTFCIILLMQKVKSFAFPC